LQQKGWDVIPLSRADFDLGTGHMAQKISGADVVINLAGASIVHRWSEAYKEELRNSRIITTERLVDAMAVATQVPKLFISTSAIGIYAEEGRHTELDYNPAGDFIGKLCQDWETEAKVAAPYIRTVIFRLGIVMAGDGGALPKMLLPFKLGLGGKIGNGRQGFSWIHIHDLIATYLFVIENSQLSGTFNLTSPEPCNNLTFTKTVSRILHRPAFFTVPAFVLKLIYGEGAVAVTGGQTALPERLLMAGFQYKFPALEGALKDILDHN
jgi:TIGR01777 family protein